MEDVYEAPFTAADHTKLMKAVLQRPLHVIRYLNTPSGQSPTTLEVIDAALEVRSFDADTKARLRDARASYLRFQEERAKDSAAFTQHLEGVHAALDGKSISDMIAALDDLLAQEHLDHRSTAGLEFAKAILMDGADSIYSPDFSVYELLETTTSAGAQQEAQVDADFAAAGGGGPSGGAAAGHTTGAQQVAQVDADFAAAGGGGPSGGAAAGAGSIGAAISVIYDAFFS